MGLFDTNCIKVNWRELKWIKGEIMIGRRKERERERERGSVNLWPCASLVYRNIFFLLVQKVDDGLVIFCYCCCCGCWLLLRLKRGKCPLFPRCHVKKFFSPRLINYVASFKGIKINLRLNWCLSTRVFNLLIDLITWLNITPTNDVVV